MRASPFTDLFGEPTFFQKMLKYFPIFVVYIGEPLRGIRKGGIS